MEKIKNYLLAVLLVVGVILVAVVPLVYRVTHIDATEMRVFVDNWIWILLGVACLIVVRYNLKH